MAYDYSGFKKSLKLVITKTPHPTGDPIQINENGQGSFVLGETTYPALTDDEFAKLVANGTDGSWEIRKNAFIAYLQDKYALEPDLLYSINWSNSRVEATTINIRVSQSGPAQGIYTIYPNPESPMSEVVTIVLKDTISNNEYTLYTDSPSGVQLDPIDDILTLSVVTISPEIGLYARYTVSIDGQIIM